MSVDIEKACEVMHDAYERAAVGAGWKTQEVSRKPWTDVPEANKATMRVAVGALLDWLGSGSPVCVCLRTHDEAPPVSTRRPICACGVNHYYCDGCGKQLGPCDPVRAS